MRKEYYQKNNAATLAKWCRMCANTPYSHKCLYVQVGFSSWYLDKTETRFKIVATTNYHEESILDEMYAKNFKNWSKNTKQ